MNINMLRDADNDPGFYAAACATNTAEIGWPGCQVYVSVDSGTTYSVAFNVPPPESVLGVTTDALADFAGGNIPDEISSVNVELTHGSLSSTTFSGLLSGANAAVIGDEILFFRDATLEVDGSYTLRGFLRGRRGSEYAMPLHAAGERFVLVDMARMVRVAQSTADIGIPKLYKPVSAGRTLALTASQTFTNEGTGLKPYAPVHLGGGRDASGNLTINWVRRNRISAEWRDSVDVPNSETSESYVVEIYDDDEYTSVLRTITGLSSPTTSYSAANQTTDFGSPQSTIYFKVYQLSAVIGRGHAALGSV
jgi:hypothetical protein